MRWKLIAAMVLGVLFLATAGCAHRSHVKAGDQAMEQNNPRAAVEHYRKAHRMRPNSEAISNKLDRAEEEVLHDALERIAEGMAGDDADEAMVEALEATRLIEEPDRLDMLERRAERIVLDESSRRQDRGEYQGALDLIEIHVEAFGQPLEPVANRDRSIRAEWYEVLREEGDAYMSADRPAAGALYFAKANAVARVGETSARALGAYERMMRQYSWGVMADADAGERHLSRILDRAFDEELPPAIRDGRQAERYGWEAKQVILVGEPVFEQWDEAVIRSDEYQSGTEWVPNPEYEAAYQRALDAEERMLQAERDVSSARRELRDAERRLREAQRDGRSTSIDESRVDRAHRNLDRRESQLDDRRYDLERRNLEMRRIEQYVEQPVYTEHRYEVILQYGLLYTEVRTEVEVEELDFAAHVSFDVEHEEVTEYYDAQPELRLASRYDPLPTVDDLRGPLDDQIGEGIGVFLNSAFQMYRTQLLEDAQEGSTREDMIDALARFVLLDRRQRDSQVEQRLVEYTGFEDAGALLIGLAAAAER